MDLKLMERVVLKSKKKKENEHLEGLELRKRRRKKITSKLSFNFSIERKEISFNQIILFIIIQTVLLLKRVETSNFTNENVSSYKNVNNTSNYQQQESHSNHPSQLFLSQMNANNNNANNNNHKDHITNKSPISLVVGYQGKRSFDEEEDGGFIMQASSTSLNVNLKPRNNEPTERGAVVVAGGGGGGADQSEQTLSIITTTSEPHLLDSGRSFDTAAEDQSIDQTRGAQTATTTTTSEPASTTGAFSNNDDDQRIAIDANRQQFVTHDQLSLLNASTKDEPINITTTNQNDNVQSTKKILEKTSRAGGMSKVSHVASFFSAPFLTASSASSSASCPGTCRSIFTGSLFCKNEINASCPSFLQKCCDKDIVSFNGTPVETSAPLSNTDADINTTSLSDNIHRNQDQNQSHEQTTSIPNQSQVSSANETQTRPLQASPPPTIPSGETTTTTAATTATTLVGSSIKQQAASFSSDGTTSKSKQSMEPAANHLHGTSSNSIYFLSSGRDTESGAGGGGGKRKQQEAIASKDADVGFSGPASKATGTTISMANQEATTNNKNRQQSQQAELAQSSHDEQSTTRAHKYPASQSFDSPLNNESEQQKATPAPTDYEVANTNVNRKQFENKIVVVQTANGTILHQSGGGGASDSSRLRRPLYANWTDFQLSLLAHGHANGHGHSRPMSANNNQHVVYHSNIDPVKKFAPESGLTTTTTTQPQQTTTTTTPPPTTTTTTTSTTTTTQQPTTTQQAASSLLDNSNQALASGVGSVLADLFDSWINGAPTSSSPSSSQSDEPSSGQAPTETLVSSGDSDSLDKNSIDIPSHATDQVASFAAPENPNSFQSNDRRLGYDISFRQQQQQQQDSHDENNSRQQDYQLQQQQQQQNSDLGLMMTSDGGSEQIVPIAFSESNQNSVIAEQQQQQLGNTKCAGFCALPLFSMLCDSTYKSSDCVSTAKCCIIGRQQVGLNNQQQSELSNGNANEQQQEQGSSMSGIRVAPSQQQQQKQSCRGSCLPVYHSSLCTKPNEIQIDSAGCLPNFICCVQPTIQADADNQLDDLEGLLSSQTSGPELSAHNQQQQQNDLTNQQQTVRDNSLFTSLLPPPPPSIQQQQQQQLKSSTLEQHPIQEKNNENQIILSPNGRQRAQAAENYQTYHLLNQPVPTMRPAQAMPKTTQSSSPGFISQIYQSIFKTGSSGANLSNIKQRNRQQQIAHSQLQQQAPIVGYTINNPYQFQHQIQPQYHQQGPGLLSMRPNHQVGMFASVSQPNQQQILMPPPIQQQQIQPKPQQLNGIMLNNQAYATNPLQSNNNNFNIMDNNIDTLKQANSNFQTTNRFINQYQQNLEQQQQQPQYQIIQQQQLAQKYNPVPASTQQQLNVPISQTTNLASFNDNNQLILMNPDFNQATANSFNGIQQKKQQQQQQVFNKQQATASVGSINNKIAPANNLAMQQQQQQQQQNNNPLSSLQQQRANGQFSFAPNINNISNDRRQASMNSLQDNAYLAYPVSNSISNSNNNSNQPKLTNQQQANQLSHPQPGQQQLSFGVSDASQTAQRITSSSGYSEHNNNNQQQQQQHLARPVNNNNIMQQQQQQAYKQIRPIAQISNNSQQQAHFVGLKSGSGSGGHETNLEQNKKTFDRQQQASFDSFVASSSPNSDQFKFTEVGANNNNNNNNNNNQQQAIRVVQQQQQQQIQKPLLPPAPPIQKTFGGDLATTSIGQQQQAHKGEVSVGEAKQQQSFVKQAPAGSGTKNSAGKKQLDLGLQTPSLMSPSSSNLNVLHSSIPYIDLKRVEGINGGELQSTSSTDLTKIDNNNNNIAEQQQQQQELGRKQHEQRQWAAAQQINDLPSEQNPLACPSSCLAPFISFNCVKPNYIDENLTCPTSGAVCCVKVASSINTPVTTNNKQKVINNIPNEQDKSFQATGSGLIQNVGIVSMVDNNKLEPIGVGDERDDQVQDESNKHQVSSSEQDNNQSDQQQASSELNKNKGSSGSQRGTSGHARGRVMGGFDAKQDYWCWQAALMNNKNEYLCGGALIGTRWVLTAAHCVTQHLRSESQLYVRLGQTNLNSTLGNKNAKTIQVKTSYVHHNHNGVTLDNDIALLRLEEPVDLNDPSSSSICLICLPEKRSSQGLEAGKRCTVTGYGFETEDGPAALRVRQTELPIVSDQECQNKTSLVLGKPFTLPASSFCAGGELGQDACHGDGGSPLNCLVDGYYELTGIVSWGYKCGGKDLPGLYSKVSTFVGWINQIVSVNN